MRDVALVTWRCWTASMMTPQSGRNSSVSVADGMRTMTLPFNFLPTCVRFFRNPPAPTPSCQIVACVIMDN